MKTFDTSPESGETLVNEINPLLGEVTRPARRAEKILNEIATRIGNLAYTVVLVFTPEDKTE